MEEWLRSVRLYAGAQRRKQRAMRLQSEEEGVYNLTSRSKTDSAAGGGLGDVDSSSYSSGGADVLERPPLEPPMARTREAITAAMSAVSKELIWKVRGFFLLFLFPLFVSRLVEDLRCIFISSSPFWPE